MSELASWSVTLRLRGRGERSYYVVARHSASAERQAWWLAGYRTEEEHRASGSVLVRSERLETL